MANNQLYFAAINYANSQGTKLWKTDGTPHGTVAVKDITPDATSYYPVPYYFTNVNGTVFFIGDDDVKGAELWKTDGTEQGTQLVKDITPGADASGLYNLVNYNGKLYFTNNDVLWSSDGTENGTQPVKDAFLSTVDIYNVTPAGNKLFISGNTERYGFELYEGEITETGNFAAAKTDKLINPITSNVQFYPNPAKDVVNIKLNALNNNVASLIVTDVSGKTVLNKNITSIKGETITQLNVSQLAAGTYFIKLINADGSEKTVSKFVKQ